MLPKTGKELHRRSAVQDRGLEFGQAVAGALRKELGATHQAIKTVMRWTGASERTVKHWFAGTHGPSGLHLVALVRHSDAVLVQFLQAADRRTLLIGVPLQALRVRLRELADLIDGEGV